MPPLLHDDPTKLKKFAYTAPVPSPDKPKRVVALAGTDRLMAAIQVMASGGENNLHSHTHLDGFWFVLKGRARFYSDEKTVAAELGPHEGVLIPRGVKYWFESAGSEPLEILQLECSDVSITDKEQLRQERVNYTPRVRIPGSEHGVIAARTE